MVSLCESGIGEGGSLGLTTAYFPMVMALILMSSAMHLLVPDRSSKRIETVGFAATMMMIRESDEICRRRSEAALDIVTN